MKVLRLLVLLAFLAGCATGPTGPTAVTITADNLEITRLADKEPKKYAWGDISAMEVGSVEMGEHTFESLSVNAADEAVLVCTAKWNEAPHQQGFMGSYYGDVRVSEESFAAIQEAVIKAAGLKESQPGLWTRQQAATVVVPSSPQSFGRLPMKIGPPK